MSMIGLSHMITYEQWIKKLENKDLVFLNNQLSCKGHNGKEYDRAIRDLFEKKKKEGDSLPRKRPRPTCVLEETEQEDDDKYVTRHVKSGPKGETKRVRVPRDLDSGD